MSQGTISELERESYGSTRGADLARELGVRAEWLQNGIEPKYEDGSSTPPRQPVMVAEDSPGSRYHAARVSRSASATAALETLAAMLRALPPDQATEVGHLLNAFATARGDSTYIPLLDAKLAPPAERRKRAA